ncbi:hypothetical protein Plhal304r1_c034g0106041 [Plasmopara halstedii]
MQECDLMFHAQRKSALKLRHTRSKCFASCQLKLISLDNFDSALTLQYSTCRDHCESCIRLCCRQ